MGSWTLYGLHAATNLESELIVFTQIQVQQKEKEGISMEQKKGLAALEEKHYDFDIDHVPPEALTPDLGVIAVGWAYPCQTAVVLAGFVIAGGLPVKSAIIACIIGGAINGIVSLLSGIMGVKGRLGIAMLSRYSYGNVGSILPSFIMWSVLLMWLWVCTFIIGTIISALMPAGWVKFGYVVGVFLAMAVGILPVLYGIKGPEWVAYLTVPLTIVTAYLALSSLITKVGWDSLLAYQPKQPISMGYAISIAAGTFLSSSLCWANFSRFAKTYWGAALSLPVGVFVFNTYVVILGCLGVAAFGQANVIEKLNLLPLVGAVAIFVFYAFAMINTQSPVTYETALNWSNIFQIPKQRPAIYFGLIAGAIALGAYFVQGVFYIFSFWLDYVVAAIPPAVSIIMADFFFISHWGEYGDVKQVTRKVNWVAIISFIVGFFFNLWTLVTVKANPGAGFTYGMPGINGLFLSGIVYTIVTKVLTISTPVSVERV